MKNRKKNRMKGFDYSSNNLYFITNCVKNNLCCFGNVISVATVGTGRDLSVHHSEYHHSEYHHSEYHHSEYHHSEYHHSKNHHSENPHSEYHHSEYHHSEYPHSKNPHSKNPHSENPHSENPHSENPHSKNHHSKNHHSENHHSENHHSEYHHSKNHHSEYHHSKNPHSENPHSENHHSKNPHFENHHSENHHSENPHFENIVMQLNLFGEIVKNQIEWLMFQYPYVDIHNYVIMPNHFHLIIQINSNRVDNNIKIKTISSLMGALKTTSSRKIHELGFLDFCWHRSFHDHIIRNEKEYFLISNYIDKNPQKWFKDRFYSVQLKQF